MFGKLKEKLKSWFSTSKEKIEQTEIVKTKEDKKKKSSLKKPEKADKLIEKAKKQKSKPIPTKFNVGLQKFEPDIERIKKEKTKEKQIIKVEKIIEEAKDYPAEIPPLQFDISGRVLQPDTDKIKENAEKLKEEIKEAEKKERELKEVEKILKKSEEKVELEKKSFFSKLKSSFSYKISENEFKDIFDDLELILLENNVALKVIEDLREKLSEKLIGREIKREKLEDEIKNELKKALNELIIEPDNPLDIIKNTHKPFVILFFGINGTGKTTSIAKIAYFLKNSGFKVVMAAADTFRAASIEQLSEHAKNINIPIIKHDYGADPAAVGFDAINYAKAHHCDVVLIDTAGRMHTKTNLLEEMKKIDRVTKPDLKIFVAESIAGNDATEQARTFHKAIEIDGSILSKADIDEKGGTILSVSHATNKPIFYLGTGQSYDDLQLFNKQKFIESLGL